MDACAVLGVVVVVRVWGRCWGRVAAGSWLGLTQEGGVRWWCGAVGVVGGWRWPGLLVILDSAAQPELVVRCLTVQMKLVWQYTTE